MGVRVTIEGVDYQIENYSVSEAATPLAAGDSSGAVGEFSFDMPYPDPDLYPDAALNVYGAEWLIDQTVEIVSDSFYGFTLGRVDSVTAGNVAISVSCESRTGALNVYGIQAEPFIGTLDLAFEYYLGLAGITEGFRVDASIADREVVMPGFSGELWFHLKQMAAAQDCDISLVSGEILLRPIRVRVAERGRVSQLNGATGAGSLAQAVEVYWYDSRPITNELVYPIGGWDPETEVLNVNAGETTEYTLELSASLSSIQTPVMQTFVAQGYNSSSVYTVVADDGLPVPVGQWEDFGGKVEVTLNGDTSSLTVTLTGAEGVPLATGGTSNSFSLALASDTSGSRYSTLRIVGTGVGYTKEKKRIRTGVSPDRTSTDIGVTIDNPFITDLDGLYRAGVRAAKAFTGVNPTLNATVTTVNRRGDAGTVTALSYGAVEDALALNIGGTPTYADVENWYAAESFTDYGGIYDYWLSQTADDFSNQTFGNVQGARVYDPTRKRWFRVRQATIGPQGISVQADDDLTQGDVDEFFSGQTYGMVELARSGLTYQQERTVGLRA